MNITNISTGQSLVFNHTDVLAAFAFILAQEQNFKLRLLIEIAELKNRVANLITETSDQISFGNWRVLKSELPAEKVCKFKDSCARHINQSVTA